MIKFFTLLVILYNVANAGFMLDSANNVFGRGEYSQAINLYKEAAYFYDENPTSCYYNIANAYFKQDSLGQSIINYRICLTYSPEYMQAHINMATVYFKLGEYPSAIAKATEVLRTKSDDKTSLLILAESYRQLNAISESIITYEKLVALDNRDERAYIVISEMYDDLEDYKSAILWLERFPEDGKNSTIIYMRLAEIYEKTDNLEKALHYMKLAFDSDKTKKWFYYKIVNYQDRLGYKNLALENVQDGLDLFENFAELAIFGANLAFEQKNIPLAEMLYTKAYKLGSPDAVIGLDNIRIYRKMNL